MDKHVHHRKELQFKFDILFIGGGLAGTRFAIAAKDADPSKSVAVVSYKPMTYPKPDYVEAIRDINSARATRLNKKIGYIG